MAARWAEGTWIAVGLAQEGDLKLNNWAEHDAFDPLARNRGALRDRRVTWPI
jgi:hypothetical protein